MIANQGVGRAALPPFSETVSSFTKPTAGVSRLFALFLVVLAAIAVQARGAQVERHLITMGTRLVIETEAPSRPDALAASEAAAEAVETANRRLSTWREDSELSAFNRAVPGTPHRLSSELSADLHRARELSALTGGAFDPAIGALLDAWAVRDRGRIPTDRELAAARAGSGMARVTLSGTLGERRHEGVRLDAGGFGKGVALDAAAAAARRAGATCVRLDFGGQTLVSGECAPVAIGVAEPQRRNRPALELLVRSGSLATSGNSVRGRAVADTAVGHILDPRTGRPAPDFGSVTVWAADATTADALSTALFVMGPQDGLNWLGRQGGVEALFLLSGPEGPRLLASAGMRAALESKKAALGDGAADSAEP